MSNFKNIPSFLHRKDNLFWICIQVLPEQNAILYRKEMPLRPEGFNNITVFTHRGVWWLRASIYPLKYSFQVKIFLLQLSDIKLKPIILRVLYMLIVLTTSGVVSQFSTKPHWWHGMRLSASALRCWTPGLCLMTILYELITSSQRASCPGFLNRRSHCKELWSVLIRNWLPYKKCLKCLINCTTASNSFRVTQYLRSVLDSVRLV